MTEAILHRLRTLPRFCLHFAVAYGLCVWLASGAYAGGPRNAAAIEQQLERAATFADTGQWRDAEQVYRAILRKHPGYAPAYTALKQLAATRDLPALSYASRSTQQRLADHFLVYQTERFILFSDVSEELTHQSAAWVERAHDEFVRFANDCGLQPLPLQHKLVCILFDRREDYLAFARTQDNLHNITFTGYYSPRHDRVVFSVEPQQRDSFEDRRVADRRSDFDGDREKSVLGFESGSDAEDEPRHVRIDRHGHGHDVSCDSAAKCVHEVIHQLMFHTRVMSPEVQYPLWVCEGLSTAFETDTPGLAFGPDHDYAPRCDAFEALLRRDDLMPLRDLVTVTELSGIRPHAIRNVYQQSYALATWMCRERKDELREYLDLMRTQPGGRLSADQHLAIFEQTFGDIDDLEDEWLEHERAWRMSRE